MMTDPIDRQPVEEPLAALERRLINEYLAAAGFDLASLLERHDAEALQILARASLHATGTLAEVEARLHYLRKLHGDE
jgi:hypothetical protein